VVAADSALVQKLQEELKYEKETNANKEVPEFLKTIQEQGIWQVSFRFILMSLFARNNVVVTKFGAWVID
jgi:hypothetical protein